MKIDLPAPVRRKPVDYWNVLCSKAFEVVPGADYNRVASQMRDTAEGFARIFYEVVCKEDHPWEDFKNRVYPCLARYLNYKSLDPASGQGLIVSLYPPTQKTTGSARGAPLQRTILFDSGT